MLAFSDLDDRVTAAFRLMAWRIAYAALVLIAGLKPLTWRPCRCTLRCLKVKPSPPNYPQQACPIKITKILTDNGKEFTDRLFASREREPSGQHVFDQTYQQFNIEHRLIKPRTPRTNGMVERFNGRIAEYSVGKSVPHRLGCDI
jgi:transposase InsO family protein